ncbi:universal stress protein [Ornithinimicrobium ciconiae]|uniref:Universal stress protein n=1 Tax=Ornithinimicrobium ciconiae TaxID=2594265 RepID=A0A516GCK2_9MICO|nr:universal stress protein [Ornithinimicrobium ciconiae]QDO89255.1 universal stress protein [Ornithinimicrobium ciconiae]
MNSQDSRPVVVGFDGSDRATTAVEWAARAAERGQAPLVVVCASNHIQFVPDAGVGLWTPEEAHQASLATAERGAEVARATASGLAVRTASSLASGAAALEKHSVGARLVVVGNSGHGRVAGVLLGSTAFHVATHARCPVVLVPGAADLPLPGPGAGVVVATDGSESGAKAVEQAAELAAHYGAPLRVLTVWQRPAQDRYARPPAGLGSPAEAEEAVRTASARVAESAVQAATQAQPDLTVTSALAEGRAAEAIARESADAALLVVGARGRGDLASLLLGSTSRAVLHLATVPVLIVR